MSTIAPTATTAAPDTATSPAASIEAAPRYQVQPVLWGNRKRFVVRDTATGTTIAIRTTSQIAESDLFRLTMTAGSTMAPWVAAVSSSPGS